MQINKRQSYFHGEKSTLFFEISSSVQSAHNLKMSLGTFVFNFFILLSLFIALRSSGTFVHMCSNKFYSNMSCVSNFRSFKSFFFLFDCERVYIFFFDRNIIYFLRFYYVFPFIYRKILFDLELMHINDVGLQLCG